MRAKLGAMLAAVVILPLTLPTPSQAQEDSVRSKPGTVVVETIGDLSESEETLLIEEATDFAESLPTEGTAPAPDSPLGRYSANATAGISVTYNTSSPVPASVKNVINSAVAQWDSVLGTSSGPVEIEFYWSCMSSGVLGSAGPTGFYQHSSLPTNDWYPAALANTLLGYDLTDSVEGHAVPEIQVILNASLAYGNSCGTAGGLWYVGTSGSPGAGQLDLYSVAVHEIGHGLGFLGSAQDTGSGPQLSSPPFGYDRLVNTPSGPLLSQPDPNSYLTSNNLTIGIGGNRSFKVYAPAWWQQGSSLSHFDEATYGVGSAGALMSPTLNQGETVRNIDAPTAGVMQQIGWPMDVRAVSPANLTVSASGATVNATWSHNLRASGLPPTGYRVELVRDGNIVATTNVPGTTSSAAVNGFIAGQSHEVRVTPTGPGGDGAYASAGAVPPNHVSVSRSVNTYTVNWDAPVVGFSPNDYTVQVSINGGAYTAMGNSGSTSISSTSLPGQVLAQFRVRSNTQFGSSAWAYSTIIGLTYSNIRPFPLDGQVGRLYTAYLNRAPDSGGMNYWMSQRAGGLSIEAISAAFADSAEFQNTYGVLSNSQFIDLVYNNVLTRTPDAQGRAYWLGLLNNGMPRGSVMTAFADSPEYINATETVAPTSSEYGKIYRVYLAFFLRAPDAGGAAYWASILGSGTSLNSIANEFSNSSEFQARYGPLNNEQFVELVYSNVLGRSPDPSGKAFWIGKLASGTSRGEVMVGFSESVEFILISGSIP